MEPARLPLCLASKFPSSRKGTGPWGKAQPSDPNVITPAKPHCQYVHTHCVWVDRNLGGTSDLNTGSLGCQVIRPELAFSTLNRVIF